MRRPSVAALMSIGLTQEQALDIRYCMWVHSSPQNALRRVSEIMGAHGVESLGVNEMGPQIDYVNRGETYQPTVIYSRGSGSYYIRSWGDVVEAWDRRHPRKEQ